jgi:hypothetical protein
MKKRKKRYQVFISSTFHDLEKERQVVLATLLKYNCIPSGMELFPAADDSSWDLIKDVISSCDFYLVISAGKYGTIHPDTGKSFTEMEYEYAQKIGIPVLAFLHYDIDSLPLMMTEKSDDKRKKLSDFQDKLRSRNVCFWSNTGSLAAEVGPAILNVIESKSAIGWVRGDVESEAVKLGEEVDMLKVKVKNYEVLLADILDTRADPTKTAAQGIKKSYLRLLKRKDVKLLPGLINFIQKNLGNYTHISDFVDFEGKKIEKILKGKFDSEGLCLFIKSMRVFDLIKKKKGQWYINAESSKVKNYIELGDVYES